MAPEITNEVIYAELKAWKSEDIRKHDELKDDVKEVKRDIKEFSSLCGDRRRECSGVLHTRVNTLSNTISRLNGKLGNGDKPGALPGQRKHDWVKENWKLLGLLILLAAIAGNRIEPLVKALFGLNY